MTSHEVEAVSLTQRDAVLQQAQDTGKLPVHWWTSESCWRMLAKLAGQFANSSMVPSAYRNEPGNVMVALAAGMPLGLSPLACLQSVAVINGKPTLYGDAPMAQVLAHPSLVGIDESATGSIAKGDRVWTVQVRRKHGDNVVATTRGFSIQDAKRAGLWDKAGPWKSYPDRMLYNRARAYAVRDSFADVLQGVQLAADATEDTSSVQQTSVQPAVVVTADVATLQEPAQQVQQQPMSDNEVQQEHDSTCSDPWESIRYVVGTPQRGTYTLHDDWQGEHAEFLCNLNGDDCTVVSIEVDADTWTLLEQRARDTLRGLCAAAFRARRASASDAHTHVAALFGLDEPTKLADLTLTQLAALEEDLR